MIHAFKILKRKTLVRTTLALAMFSAAVNAEPYIAVRTGFKCSQCHLNNIGGGGRTEYGQAYTQYKLVMKQTQEAILSGREGALTSFDPKLSDAVTIGSNFRMEQTAVQKNKSAPSNNQLGISEGNVYINVELVKNFLSFYTDIHVGASSGSREVWMMVRKLPLNSYVKVGKTLLPYGFRLMDDQAFIRDRTDYTYNNPAVAGEIGIEPGPVSLVTNLTNDRSSTVGYVTYRRFRVGGSYGTSVKNAHTNKFDRYGPFVGVNLGKFTLLSEMDFIERAAGDSTVKQTAQFYELNFLPHQGLNFKGTYEYFDRNTTIANKRDGQDRITLGVEHFPVQFMQLGLYYRINRAMPQFESENQDMVIGRAQVFF